MVEITRVGRREGGRNEELAHRDEVKRVAFDVDLFLRTMEVLHPHSLEISNRETSYVKDCGVFQVILNKRNGTLHPEIEVRRRVSLDDPLGASHFLVSGDFGPIYTILLKEGKAYDEVSVLNNQTPDDYFLASQPLTKSQLEKLDSDLRTYYAEIGFGPELTREHLLHLILLMGAFAIEGYEAYNPFGFQVKNKDGALVAAIKFSIPDKDNFGLQISRMVDGGEDLESEDLPVDTFEGNLTDHFLVRDGVAVLSNHRKLGAMDIGEYFLKVKMWWESIEVGISKGEYVLVFDGESSSERH